MLEPALYPVDSLATSFPWLESPFTAELLAAADYLTDKERQVAQHYADHGYVILDNVFSDRDLTLAATDTFAATRQADGSYTNRVQDHWLHSHSEGAAAIARIACNSELLDNLRMLYRREPIPFQTLNFPLGTQQATHSDTIHFHSAPARFMCGIWVALEDIDAGSGPLHYYPGSHKLPLYTCADFGALGLGQPSLIAQRGFTRDLYKKYEVFIEATAKAAGLARKTLCIKRGQCLIWSANLLHGGDAINDPRLTRCSQVSHYFFRQSVHYTPLLSDLNVGQMSARTPLDIRTRRAVGPNYGGHKVAMDAAHPSRPPEFQNAPHHPYRLPVTARARAVAWPDYADEAALAELAAALAEPAANRPDFCLCLRHDRLVDVPLPVALDNLNRALRARFEGKPAARLIVLNEPLDDDAIWQLAQQIDFVVYAGQPEGARRRLLHLLPRKVMAAAEVGTYLDRMLPQSAALILAAGSQTAATGLPDLARLQAGRKRVAPPAAAASPAVP